MPRKIWSLAIASVLVSIILLYSQVVATDADGHKKIAAFLDRTPLDMQQQAVALSKSTVVHTLSFINALTIELPDVGTAEALAFLLNYTVLRAHIVVGVYDDPVFSILPITPALPPPQQTYNWELEHIRVDDAHEKMPTMTGVGVQVAMLDTRVGPHADLPTLVDGFNALSGGPELYSDDHGHATHIAGIIAARANNDVGLISAAPRASLVMGDTYQSMRGKGGGHETHDRGQMDGQYCDSNHPRRQLSSHRECGGSQVDCRLL